MPLVEQEMPILPEHLRVSPVFEGFVLLNLSFSVYSFKLEFIVCTFVLFLRAIMLSVFFQFMFLITLLIYQNLSEKVQTTYSTSR